LRYLVTHEWARGARDALWRRSKLGLTASPQMVARWMNGWRRTVRDWEEDKGMSRNILSIDQGTTSTRALIFDENRRAGQRAAGICPALPADGWVEHDAEDIWRDTLATARGALEKAGLTGADIAAIGITNQRETVVLWDRATAPAAPRDRVAGPAHRRSLRPLRAQGHEALVQERTGLLLDPYFSGTKLAWLLDTIPGARERAEKGELAFGTIDTFLLWRLTEGVSTRPM
jgi:glycerol kinase